MGRTQGVNVSSRPASRAPASMLSRERVSASGPAPPDGRMSSSPPPTGVTVSEAAAVEIMGGSARVTLWVLGG